MSIRRLVLLPLVGALALAACGGGGDSAEVVRGAAGDSSGTYTGPAEVNGCEIRPNTFCDADFENVDLSYADLSGTRFGGMGGVRWRNVNLTGANLSGATIRSMEETAWEGVNLTGANLSGAQLSCLFSDGLTMPGANFSNAELMAVDFTQANLSAANFTNARLYGVDFYQANLNNTTFKGATLLDVSLIGSSMNGADTSWAEAIGTWLPNGDWASGPRGGMAGMNPCAR